MNYKRNGEVGSRNHVAVVKQLSIKYSGCVYVALVIYYAKRIILSSVRMYHIFSCCLSKFTIFGRKKVTEHKMCVLIFCTTFV